MARHAARVTRLYIWMRERFAELAKPCPCDHERVQLTGGLASKAAACPKQLVDAWAELLCARHHSHPWPTPAPVSEGNSKAGHVKKVCLNDMISSLV